MDRERVRIAIGLRQEDGFDLVERTVEDGHVLDRALEERVDVLDGVDAELGLSLVTLFSIHFMAAIENAGKYVEFSIEGSDYYPWQNGIFSPGFEIRDGNVLLSDKPGWGIEIDPEWIALADYRVSYNQASS